MDKKLVSIIIPVYNVEKYINECLLSVLNQTYKYIEIIIIDDKGTDNSINIVRETLKLSPYKYLVVDQIKNTGVSEARNVGINKANGEYIFFLDGDDLISSDCIQILMEYAEKYKSDLVMGEFCSFHKENFDVILDTAINTINNQNIQHKKIKYDDICNYVWNCIYKKELIINNNIFFEKDLKFAEDILWMMLIQFKAKNMIKVKAKTYYYRITSESASVILSKGNRYIINLLQLLKKLFYYYRTKNLDNKEKGVIISRIRMFKNGLYSTIVEYNLKSSDFNYKELKKIKFGIGEILNSSIDKKGKY